MKGMRGSYVRMAHATNAPSRCYLARQSGWPTVTSSSGLPDGHIVRVKLACSRQDQSSGADVARGEPAVRLCDQRHWLIHRAINLIHLNTRLIKNALTSLRTTKRNPSTLRLDPIVLIFARHGRRVSSSNNADESTQNIEHKSFGKTCQDCFESA